MAYINDNAFDAALNYIGTANRLDICSAEPADVTAARTTNSLGNDAITPGSPTNGDVSGRKIVIPAITAGSVTGTGTASHWAISNTTVLMATGSLSASQAVTSGNEFTLGAFDITFPDAVNA